MKTKLPKKRSRMPILSGVRRRPENREGRATLFAHFTATLGGVSGRGDEKGSSLKRDACTILELAGLEKIGRESWAKLQDEKRKRVALALSIFSRFRTRYIQSAITNLPPCTFSISTCECLSQNRRINEIGEVCLCHCSSSILLSNPCVFRNHEVQHIRSQDSAIERMDRPDLLQHSDTHSNSSRNLR